MEPQLKSNRKLGILIVAAGRSSRLGHPKQLVEYQGVPLLQRIIGTAKRLCLANISSKIVCILGHDSDKVIKKINLDSVEVIINNSWQRGMGTSIALGTTSLSSSVDGLLILLCDQFLLNHDDLERIVSQWNSHPEKIVATAYFENKQRNGVYGVPAIFPNQYFSDLAKLKNKGARELIEKNKDNVISVEIENVCVDLDTPDDLRQLRNHEIRTNEKE